MSEFIRKLARQLEERQRQASYRYRRVKHGPEAAEIVVDGKSYINFSSNDYLGLANHPRIREAFKRGIDVYGVGSGASHLIAGHSRAHHQLEEELATFTGRSRALLFSTGYMANLGVMTALADRGDTVIEDRLNHASLIDAALLCRARLQRYPHADVDRLEAILTEQPTGQSFVLTDGVFSMDGDIAPLPAIAASCTRHAAVLMVDDAHGFGVLGPNGNGSLAQFGLKEAEVPILMATLGKALGVFGAFVAGSEEVIETLIQQGRSYIYTTALPPAIAEAIRESLRLVQEESWRRQQLQELITYFKKSAAQLGLRSLPSQTAIQPIIVGEATAALQLAAKLQEQGIYVVAIRPPTVPKGTARLRITLTAGHSREQLERLLIMLEQLSRDG